MNLGKLKNVVWPDLATRHIAVTCFKTRDEFSATGSLDPQRSYRQCLEKKSDFKGGIRSTRCRNGECQDGDQQRKGESTPNILPTSESTLSPRCLVSCIVYVSSPARLFFADTPNFPVHFPLGTGLSIFANPLFSNFSYRDQVARPLPKDFEPRQSRSRWSRPRRYTFAVNHADVRTSGSQ